MRSWKLAALTLLSWMVVLMGLAALLPACKGAKAALDAFKNGPRPATAKTSTYRLAKDKQPMGTHSLATIDGVPAVMYWTKTKPVFMQATTAVPKSAADWKTSEPYSKTTSVWYCLREIGGKPAFLLLDKETGHVMYGEADSARPVSASNWTCTAVKGATAHSFPCGLAEIDGCPVAVLKDKEGDRLHYFTARRKQAGGWEWSSSLISSHVKCAPSMCTERLIVIDGKPVVATFTEDRRLIVLAAKTASPKNEDDWQLEVVDDGQKGEVGIVDFGFAAIDGEPALAWEYLDTFELFYSRRSVDAGTGQAAWHKSTVLKWTQFSSGLKLVEFDKRPVIIYSFWQQAFAFHASSPQPAGNSDWCMYFIDDNPGSDFISDNGAIVIDGKLFVTYYNDKPAGLCCTVMSEAPK